MIHQSSHTNFIFLSKMFHETVYYLFRIFSEKKIVTYFESNGNKLQQIYDGILLKPLVKTFLVSYFFLSLHPSSYPSPLSSPPGKAHHACAGGENF